MNVTELARRLRVHPKKLVDILPEYGFDIGKKAIKIDDRVATQVMKQWRRIKKDLEDKERREQEEKKRKEKELRKQSGVEVALPHLITVREFADRLNLPVTQIITELMKNGILANQNQNIDHETAAIMAEELGFSVKQEDTSAQVAAEEEKTAEVLEEALSRGDKKTERAPVVVVMGHVDHGKTKLLDTIRHANIIDTESGGITQHIGAYQTIWKDPKTGDERALSFIDTPGHEAFTVMRSRGAKVADIGILVVAADDGVKPQTVEVIQILKAAKLPFVVAINKIDKETADVQKTMTELSQHNIIPEAWGGDVPMVEISAKNNINIDALLDTLLLVADVNADSITADATVAPAGTVIESHKDKNIGPVATILIQTGTLRVGDKLIFNNEIYGKVRAMKDYNGEDIQEAGPSVPAQIIGFKIAPTVGDIMDGANADSAQKIDVKQKRTEQTGAERTTQTAVIEDEDEKNKNKDKTLNLVVKADVLGSLEAIIGAMDRFRHDEVGVRIVGKGLGNVTEGDVEKAIASKATVIGFHVKPTGSAEEKMREELVPYKYYEIIYDLTNWVHEELEKLLDQEKIVIDLGKFDVKAIFRTDKNAMTIGGLVTEGKIQEGAKVRVYRDGEYVADGVIASCQQGQEKTKEIPSGIECGVRFESKDRVEVGDVFEVFTEESKTRKIEFAAE